MKPFPIAKGLALPLEAVTEKLGFLGRTGSGKTYAAQLLAELFYTQGVQFVALDPVGNWWSLRLAADGKGVGLAIPVFGGLHGDVPLESGAGKKIADLVVDRGISAVVDVSQFESDAAKGRFVSDFGERLFWRKKASPSALHVFMEEAQEFVPQNPGKDERLMLHHWTRIQKLGRNFGIGTSLLSQRPQEVNKKVLNQTEVLFVFQLTGTHERRAVEAWIGDKGLDEDIEAELPKLERGHPHVWSPALLQISRVVEIGRKETFDASSTPKVGKRAEVKELTPIDVEQLKKEMADAVERAKAEDPKELRRQVAERDKRIRELERAKPVATPAPAKEKRVEVPVVKADLVRRLENALAALSAMVQDLTRAPAAIAPILTELTGTVRQAAQLNGRAAAPAPVRPTPAPMSRGATAPRVQTSPRPPIDGNVRIRAGARRMMEALARRHPVATSWAQVGQLAKIATSGGTFSTYQSDLRNAGFVLDDRDGPQLTAEGWAFLGQEPGALTAQTTDEMLQLYAGVLRGGARRMIEILRDVYPERLTRADLGQRANVADTGGTFSTYLSDLNKAGLVDVGRDDIGASELLMDPAGAR